MSDPVPPHLFNSPPAIFSKLRTGLWACLLAILTLAFLSSCMGMRSSGSIPQKGLRVAPSAGPNPELRAGHPASPDPTPKGKEAASPQKLQAAFARLPLSFIPNRGQVDERVRFYGKSGSASFFFARDEVVYSFVQREEGASLRKVSRSIPGEGSGRSGEEKGRGHVVRLRFVGANPDPVIEGGEALPGKVSYFIGSDPAWWKKNLSTYGQVRYRELWPGIDLIYWGQGGRLKYEFIVKPGADPGQIQVDYRGIEGLSVSDAGDLILQTASGELRDRRPVAWQEIGGRRVEVEAGFRVRGTGAPTEVSPAAAAAQRSSVVGTVSPTSVEGSHGGSRRGFDLPPGEEEGSEGDSTFVHGFEVKGYDPAYPLILDPGLEYSTFLGGSNDDGDLGWGIALDGAGNATVTGGTYSSGFPTTAGAFDTSFNGSSDAFVAKLSADGFTPDLSWPLFGHDSNHSGFSHSYEGPSSVQYHSFYSLSGWLDTWSLSSSVIDGDVIYYASGNNLRAIDKDGNIIWELEVGPFPSSPSIGLDGTIYLGTDFYNYYAIDKFGNIKWVLQTDDDFAVAGYAYSSAVFDKNGNIIVLKRPMGNPAKIHSINPTGFINWSFELGNNEWSDGPPAVDGNSRTYILSRNTASFEQMLYCIDSNGNLVWKRIFENDFIPAIFPSEIVTIDFVGNINIITMDGYLYSIDVNGDDIWKTKLNDFAFSSISWDETGELYILSHNFLYFISRYDGTIKYKYVLEQPFGDFSSRNKPVISLGTKIYFSNGYYVEAIDISTRSQLFFKTLGYNAATSMAIDSQSSLYWFTSNNMGSHYLHRIDKNSISFRLSFPLPNRSSANAVINTAFDHSMNSSLCPDGMATAYTGEEGRSEYGQSEWSVNFGCGNLHGFKNSEGSNFVVNGHYSGGGEPNYLFYDGHPGYDYRTTDQSPDGRINVLAAADGTAYVVPDSPYNTIYIDHRNDYQTYYLHLSQKNVTDGQPVTRGQIIGISGDAGSPGAPHLHFEVRKNVSGTYIPVDPYGWKGSGPDPYTRATNIDLWTPPREPAWEFIGPYDGNIYSIAVDPTNPSTIYTAGDEPMFPAGIYKSTDGGKNWSLKEIPYFVFSFDISIHRSEPDVLYVGGHDGLAKSLNGGESWVDVSEGLPRCGGAHRPILDPFDTNILITDGGMYGGIYKSTDGGMSWELSSTGLPAKDFDPCSLGFESFSSVFDIVNNVTNPATIYIALGVDGIYKTVDYAQTWFKLPLGFVITSLGIDKNNPETIYAGSDLGDILKSTDGGLTWTRTITPLSYVRCIIVDPNDSNKIYACGGATHVIQSADMGVTWSTMNDGLPNNSQVFSLVISQDNKVYAATSHGVYAFGSPPSPQLPTLSGHVTYNRTGLAGVTVAYTGPISGSATTDANGNYAIPGAPDGTYTLTPSKAGYGFYPSSQGVTVSGADVTGIDFSAYRTSESSSVEGTVFNSQSGAGLAGVSLSLGGQEVTTDGSGYYRIEEVSPGDYTLSAALSGYYSHSELLTIPARSSIRKNLSLTPRAAPGSIAVTAVTSRHSGPGKFVYFLDEVVFDQTFTASVDWGGHPPGHVRFQTPKGSFDEPSGTHTFNMGKDFGPGGRLTVTAVSTDGTESDPRVADFVVMSNPHITPNLRSVDIGDGFYYTGGIEIGDFISEGVGEDVIPDEIPLFGSKRFSFDWFNLSLSSEVTSAGTARSGVSVGGVELSKPKLRLADEELTLAPSLEIEGAYQVDTLSWDWDGYVGISGEAKIQRSWPFVVMAGPVPIPLFFKVSVKAAADALLGITGWSGTLPDFNGSFSLEPYGRGSAGAGVSDMLSVSGFIGLGATLGLQWPQEPTLDELSLFADAGIEVYGLLFHWEWPALRWDWEFVGDARLGRKAVRKEIPDLKKPGFPQLLPRDYLKRPEYGRFHQRLKLRPAVHPQALPGVSQAPLQSLVFPYSEPNVSSQGDKLYLVWLYDDPDRSAMNRTMAVFSSWDGGQWSEPHAIADDGTADFAPQILVFEDGSAIATWQDANAVLPDNATLEQMAASMEISVSQYDPGSGRWSSPIRMTANGYLDRTPRLAGSSPSQVVLTWISNAESDLSGSAAHPNEIWDATWNGTTWSTPQQIGQIANSLVKTALAFDGTTGILALSVDLDDSLETKDDQELFALTYRDGAWGPLQRLTTDSLADANPQVAFDAAGHSLLTWLKGDELVYALDLDVANRAVITTPEYSSGVADFRMSRSGNGRIGLLWADGSEEGSDLYGAFYDPIFQTWGKHQQMTFDADTERSLTVAFYGDATLVAVYNKVQIGLTPASHVSSSGKALTYAIPRPGETDLYVLMYVTGGDLAIQPGGLQISPSNPAPGTAATLSATVINLGETAAGDIPVTFYRGDPQSGGTALGTAVIAGTLASGAEGTASLDWTVPQTDTPLEIHAVVDPDRQVEDRNRANNLFHDRFIRPDLAIQSTGWFPLGTDRISIMARIVNQGVILSPPCHVSFRQGTADGTLLREVDLPLLLKDGFADVNFVWDISQSGPMSPHHTVYVAVDEAKVIEDFDRKNNHTALQVAFNQPDITLNPSSVDFGSVSVGSTAEQTVVVRNDGLADLTLGEISTPSAPFGMMTDECSQVTLIPGASCTITLSFVPTSVGSSSGSFEVSSNDPDENPATVNLGGEGVLMGPAALLSLNQTSFHPGDLLQLKTHLLTPTEVPPAGAYLFEAKLWLKTPLSPPSDLLSLLDISGPGRVVSLLPGTDQAVELLNLTVPADIPAGSYEFGLRLRHPTTGEELSVSLVPFEITSAPASKSKRSQPKAISRLAATARKSLKLPQVFSAQMPRPLDKTPLTQGLGAVRKGRAKGSLGPRVDRKAGAALVAQPTAHLFLNGASFRVGDLLQLDAQILTPTEVPLVGGYAFEIKLWLETPMSFPSDLVSIVNMAGPGGVISLPPGFDQTFRVIDTAVPVGISTGAYEFGVRLLHPVTGEELGLEVKPFNVTE